ncbi:prepilin-type N-terminal cleavage/methylation domain-containing protein [Rheinheimera sp. MMS21-TC3]|uniref:PulJ/GspJ family protein n=1 Tax=Rheinheimera sp. MMS21-TC3 TaxID=3072790 RepID=UPI0028C3A6C1|nr:prepilin-type N-terminal cleavage/methylation domain-containing protein [Rheinheimera sp. MMS21-TC3]WNO61661.1 prepilin-type N-terminal cleavage/methylation domain-containing protein [Rheinheimera sp. MMS21-TC3]
MANQRGLTLLEMLIATLILTAVLSLASGAYSFYVVGFNKSQNRVKQQMQQAKAGLAWQEQLSAAFNYAVPVEPHVVKTWFKGDKDNVSWVTTTSMQEQGKTAVAWLGVIDEVLTYCERLIIQKLLINPEFNPEKLCETYKKPIKPVKNIRLEYYSWPSARDRLNAMSDSYQGIVAHNPAWFNSVDGFDTELLPLFIKLSIDAEQESEQEPEIVWVRLENADMQRVNIFMSRTDG